MTVSNVALVAATAKTLAELGTSATDRAKIKQWWIEFDGTSSTAVPVKVEAQRASAGVTTATTLAGEKLDAADGTAAIVSKHSTTVEGAGTLNGGEIHVVPPTTGIVMQYPLGGEVVLGVSTFWRIRATAPANVNATFGVIWEE
jgi:hypothetical protein